VREGGSHVCFGERESVPGSLESVLGKKESDLGRESDLEESERIG
jgi:hypothetical protein